MIEQGFLKTASTANKAETAAQMVTKTREILKNDTKIIFHRVHQIEWVSAKQSKFHYGIDLETFIIRFHLILCLRNIEWDMRMLNIIDILV